MSADDGSARTPNRPDYRRLPDQVDLDDTVAGIPPAPPPDPEAGRNADQHRALRDD